MGVARIGSSKVGSLGRVSQDRVPRIGAHAGRATSCSFG